MVGFGDLDRKPDWCRCGLKNEARDDLILMMGTNSGYHNFTAQGIIWHSLNFMVLIFVFCFFSSNKLSCCDSAEEVEVGFTDVQFDSKCFSKKF